jgi:hypothetical protein
MTNQTSAARPALAGGAPAVPAPAALTVRQFRYDLLAFARNSQARFFTLALPVAFLLIFATVFGDPAGAVAGMLDGGRCCP